MNVNLNLQGVKGFALDVWEDLGRTRLSGVAVGLGLVLLILTVVLLRPHSAPEPTAVTAATAAIAPTEGEVSFTVPGEEPVTIADVDLSAPRDPFRSRNGLSGQSTDQTLLAAGEEMADAVMSTPAGGGGTPTLSTDTVSTLTPIDDLSGTPSPAPTTTTEPAEDLDTDAQDEPAESPPTDYSYTANVQFGLVDDLTRYRNVQRLALVPGRRNPLLMYLGVKAGSPDTAVFMVDSRLSQGGEGRCVPKASLCTFLELRTRADRDEHHFRDADGNEYLLRLRRLVRTTASAGSLQERSAEVLDGTPSLLDGTQE